MSRRRKANKREILPDPKFGDVIISKFMACLMIDGKKYSAEKIVYGAFDRIKEKSGTEPVVVFKDALENVKPQNSYILFLTTPALPFFSSFVRKIVDPI